MPSVRGIANRAFSEENRYPPLACLTYIADNIACPWDALSYALNEVVEHEFLSRC
jgi:hypothetical protein